MRTMMLTLAALSGADAAVAQPDPAPARRSGLSLDVFEAAEVLLRDVCLPGIADRKPIAQLAEQQGALPQGSKLYRAGADDKVYRLGPVSTQVYAVAWADGSCTTRVSRSSDAAKLRETAERVILARPEGFVRGRHAPDDGGRVLRSVYCAASGPEWLVASITTPSDKAGRETVSLASTVYRMPSRSPLCQA